MSESINALLALSDTGDLASLRKPSTFRCYRTLAKLGFGIKNDAVASASTVVGYMFASGIHSGSEKMGVLLQELNEIRAINLIEGRDLPAEVIRCCKMLKGCSVNFVDVYWSIYNWHDPAKRNKVKRDLISDFYFKGTDSYESN